MRKDIRFEIGDKVISLKTFAANYCQPIVRGHRYKVLATLYCIKCGIQSINVVQVKPSSSVDSSKIDCRFCGGIQPNDGNFFTASCAFIKEDQIELELELAISEERYEDAQVLHDIQKELTHAK